MIGIARRLVRLERIKTTHFDLPNLAFVRIHLRLCERIVSGDEKALQDFMRHHEGDWKEIKRCLSFMSNEELWSIVWNNAEVFENLLEL